MQFPQSCYFGSKVPTASAFPTLESRIDEIAREIGNDGLAVSLFDYETGLQWSRRGDRAWRFRQ